MKDGKEKLNHAKNIDWPQLGEIHALLIVSCMVGFQWIIYRIDPPDPRTLQYVPLGWFYPVKPWFVAIECLVLALGGLWLLKTRGRIELQKRRTIISLMLLATLSSMIFYLLIILRH